MFLYGCKSFVAKKNAQLHLKEEYEHRDVIFVVDSEKSCNINGKDGSSKLHMCENADW